MGRDYFFMTDGLHLNGKDADALVCEFVRIVDEGTNTGKTQRSTNTHPKK